MNPEANYRGNFRFNAAQPNVGWRTKTGLALFIISISWPLLLPILPLVGVSANYIVVFTGFMAVFAEIMMLAAAAIAGKEGFAYIKQRVYGVFKSYAPPRQVGARRYKIGLVIITVPLVYGFLSPYIEQFYPGIAAYRLAFAVVGDVLLLVALLVLGGEFWEKIRTLFIYKAVVSIPEERQVDK